MSKMRKMKTLLKLGGAACLMGAGAIPSVMSNIPQLAMAYGSNIPQLAPAYGNPSSSFDNHYRVDNEALLVFEDGMGGNFFTTSSRKTKFNARIAPLMYEPAPVEGWSFEGWDIPVCEVVSDAYDTGACETRETVEDKTTGIVYYAATKEEMPTTITYVAQWEKDDGIADASDPTEPGDSNIDKVIPGETDDKPSNEEAPKDDGTGNTGPISENNSDNKSEEKVESKLEENSEKQSEGLTAKSTPNTGIGALGLTGTLLTFGSLSGAGAWFWRKSKKESTKD